MSYMLDEIRQEPDVIGRLVHSERRNAAEIASEIERRDICLVIMVARGTSDHAAIYGKYLLEIYNHRAVALADPSVFTLYDGELNLCRALVIGISQSGEATDVAEYLERSKRSGALTLAISNEPGSTITRIADHTLLCHAGKEHGIAATKTYVSTLAALYLLSASLAQESRVDNLLACADSIRSALQIEDHVAARAERYRYMEAGVVLGRGLNYCTALETALKLEETSYVGMQAYSAADFLHGPIAAVHEGDPCFIIAPPGKTLATMADIAARLRERGAETVVLSSEDELLSGATTPLRMDVRVDEDLSPLIYIIPGQLLAYHLAVTRGYDPDRPRGLSKVTLTR